MDPVTQSILEVTETDKTKVARYRTNWEFYKNRQYSGQTGQAYAQANKLFKKLRAVYNCVTQIVDTDTRFIMREKLGFEAEEGLRDDIAAIMNASALQSRKYYLARQGSCLGDAWLVVDPTGEVPVIRVMNSEDMTPYYDPKDDTQLIAARQSYIYVEKGKDHDFTRIYFPDRVEEYVDQKPAGKYSHSLGRVPAVHIKVIDIGEIYGLASFHNLLPTLDALNEVGSYMWEIAKMYADPVMKARGIKKPIRGEGAGLTTDGNRNIFYIPDPQGNLEMVEFTGNVLPQLLDLMDKIKVGIQDVMPELSLSSMRSGGNMSGYAINLLMADFVAKIAELRGNFATGLETAMKMALAASGYDEDGLELTAKFDPILPQDEGTELDNLDKEVNTLKIESRKGAMMRRGLTEQKAEEKLQEIENEGGLDAEYQQRLAQEMNGNGGDNVGGA